MTSSHPDVPPCQWFSRLAASLDRRSTLRLAWLFLGALLARGRRTVTSWIRAAGLSDHFRPCYTTVAAAGKKAKEIAARLVCEVVRPLVTDQARLTLALDDTRCTPMPHEVRTAGHGGSSRGAPLPARPRRVSRSVLRSTCRMASACIELRCEARPPPRGAFSEQGPQP